MTGPNETKPPTREEVLRERLAAAQQGRALLASSRDIVSLEREVSDEEARFKLEASNPDGFASVELNAPIEGCPGFVAARDCTAAEFKRYQAGIKVRVVNKAAEVDGGTDGAAQLGRVCLIYPDEETFKRMCAARAGLESGLGQEVVTRAQTRKAEDSKK